MTELFQALPDGWHVKALGDICNIDPEMLSGAIDPNYTFRYIDIASVGPSKISDDLAFEVFRSAPSRARKRVKKDDVLMSTVRPNLKSFTKVSLEGELVASTGFAVLRAVKGKSHPEFLKQVLFSEEIERQVESLVAGSNYPAITVGNVRRLYVAVPPYTEQRGIAEVLSALDEQIELTEALKAKEVLVRNAILSQLVIESNAPYVQIGTLATKVGSGVTPTGGSEVYKTSGVAFVRSQNVLNEQLDLEDVAFVTTKTHANMAGTQLEDHDVLLNITGASIGRCCSVPTGFGEANVNQHVCIVRLHSQRKSDALLMAALICSDFGQRELNKQISGGNREGLNYPQVRSMCVPWPQSAETRAEMSSVLESARLATQALTLEAAKLRLQKQGLMRDLLTGKVRIN